MLPGLLALNAFFGGLQSVAFPLVLDFAWTREIEDRLLAPISLPLVAVEKIAGRCGESSGWRIALLASSAASARCRARCRP